MKIPTKTIERKLLAEGHTAVIGVDEVGMACLAGPVVVCALAVSPEFYQKRYRGISWLRDSKMLQPHQREKLALRLERVPGLRWEIASCSPEVIDRMNIYQASRQAMREAIQTLVSSIPHSVSRIRNTPYDIRYTNPIVLVDGNKGIKGLDLLPQKAIVKGDQKIWAIAAASILAKVHRDRLMSEYAKEYPGYGFEVHKGYPTKFHRARLAALGPCPLHRHSFGYLKNL